MIFKTKYPEFKDFTYFKWVKYAVYVFLVSWFYNLQTISQSTPVKTSKNNIFFYRYM